MTLVVPEAILLARYALRGDLALTLRPALLAAYARHRRAPMRRRPRLPAGARCVTSAWAT